MTQVRGTAALPIVGGVFLILGLVGLLAAGGLTVVELHSGRSAHAEGTIVAADDRAKVQFTTPEGETIEFRNDVRSTTTQEGDRVPVVYDPQNPHDASVDGFAGRWLLRDLFVILGGTFSVVGAGLTLAGRWLSPRRSGTGGRYA